MLEEDIEAIFSFSPDHLSSEDFLREVVTDDPPLEEKMQEDLGSHVEPSNISTYTNIEDTLVPIDDFSNELLQSTVQELWKGRVFPDRDAFRKTLAKFAMYKNFVLKHLKTNMYKVTARCGDATCPWRVHASIVDSGPQFQIWTYNPSHSCSKPTTGMAHKEETSALIAEFAKDRLRFNNKYTPKEIMFDFQMEFGVSIIGRPI